VTFVERDATDGIDGGFELVTTFDVLHDAVDPGGLLRAARRGLASDGVYLCVDINCAPKLEDNKGPVASLCGARRSVRRRRPPRRLRKRGAEMAPASRADPAAARALVPRASPWRRRAEHGSPRGGPTDRGPDARPVARARDRDARDRVISNSTERRAARSRR
jgi:hypothetical protein